MKGVKKIVTIGMLVLLIVGTLGSSTNVQAKKKAKKTYLSTKKTILYVNDVETIFLRNNKKKVKWSTSNKKVVSLSCKRRGSVDVKAKKKGKATVTAKVGKKKYKCKVTVKKEQNESRKNTTYIEGSKVPGTEIVYIADQSVYYNSENNEFRVFFSLKLKDKKTRVATNGKIEININNDKSEKVYSKTTSFTQKDFGEWTSLANGTRYLCCIKIPISTINQGDTEDGIIDFKVYVDGRGGYWDGNKHTVNNLPVIPRSDPRNYNKNFDAIVSYVKSEGKFSSTGDWCTNRYVSVSMTGQTIEIFSEYDRAGRCKVTITRGSKTAIARYRVKTIAGGLAEYATAEFDISKFKGDATDTLVWNNIPSEAYQSEYDTAVANVMKNVSNYKFYIGGYSFKDIGFASYLY